MVPRSVRQTTDIGEIANLETPGMNPQVLEGRRKTQLESMTVR